MRLPSCQVSHRKWEDAGSAPARISKMSPKQYILSTLEALKEPVRMQDIGNKSIEDAIYEKVTSKKFRKYKLGDDGVEITKNAIKIFVKENKPVRIFDMFGGNKLWRFEEAPDIDWAEVFSFTYFAQWARLIASVWEPGVIYEYFSQDISVESLNNVPRSQTNRYSETMREFLTFAKPYLPENIEFRYTRHYDLFDNPDDYYKEIEEAKKEILKKNNGEFPKLTDVMRATTELNVKLKPGQDEDPLWREKVELEHQAIFITPTLHKVSADPAKILWC